MIVALLVALSVPGVALCAVLLRGGRRTPTWRELDRGTGMYDDEYAGLV